MVELPTSMRELLVDQLDTYCENLDEATDTDALAEAVVEILEVVANEVGGVDPEEIVSKLEMSGELDASLVEVLESHFASSTSLEFTGEEIVALLEKVCEIEWTDPEFFEDGDEGEEDF